RPPSGCGNEFWSRVCFLCFTLAGLPGHRSVRCAKRLPDVIVGQQFNSGRHAVGCKASTPDQFLSRLLTVGLQTSFGSYLTGLQVDPPPIMFNKLPDLCAGFLDTPETGECFHPEFHTRQRSRIQMADEFNF